MGFTKWFSILVEEFKIIMKVLIVDTVPYNRAPYIKNYEKICQKLNIQYEIFVWNRKQNGGLCKKGRVFEFREKCDFGSGKLRKILPMYHYRKALKKTLLSGDFTHLILINTLAAVMLKKFIMTRYKHKYIMDIRDYTYERLHFYKNVVDQLIDKSAFTTISSRGFYKFIKKSPKIVINHNISNYDCLEDVDTFSKNKKITIGFVGSVRYEDENLKLIMALQNDSAFKLLYCGEIVKGCNLIEITKDYAVKNIEFTGAYLNVEKKKIYKKIDLINSLYGNNSLEVSTAVPNRFYDCLIFKKPILTSEGTYLSKLIKKYKLGLVLDLEHDDIKNKLLQYKKNFSSDEFVANCNKTLNKIVKEQDIYYNEIQKFLASKI